MWLTPQRVFYAGLLGEPSRHARGCLIVHVALEGLLTARVGSQAPATGEVVVVPPWVPYELSSGGRHAIGLLVEPETVRLDELPPLLRGCGVVDAPALADHVRRCHQRLLAPGALDALSPADFDPLFFGQALPSRELDPRVLAVLERLWREPASGVSADDCAREAGLSFSRFLHLFKEQTGVPFRSLRSWKRARSLLRYAAGAGNLVDVALDIGYPDASHFSHSIRQAYGLKPRDIVAGSRKLRVVEHRAAA
ncbi:AraC family transcriptional regulator [Ramlibacter humi]|uniref:AraC family transcriptional regulator n=2 Tax=Ramlibacter humi TaxID=2530451 RepID=A0A4Z0CC81_9BURK|nr:AraC family transcriptional regulator [Ramlibacter humi]